MRERLSVAQVTPYPWDVPHEVNTYVKRVAEGLVGRGHRVIVLAPSGVKSHVRETRRSLREAREAPGSLFGGAEDGLRVLAVGDVLPIPPAAARRRSLPLDIARTVEEAVSVLPLDFVHVHEPFAPSAGSVALRHSRALNVGSFHAPTERVLSTQVARRVVELFFGRLDGRTASLAATGELMARFFPASYRVVHPGADAAAQPLRPRDGDRPVRIVVLAHEERSAARFVLRALRRLPMNASWEAVVWSPRGSVPATQLRRELRERVSFSGPGEIDEGELLAGADVAVLASLGAGPAPAALVRALAAGAIPVASRLAPYEELLAEGERGLLFEPGDLETLVGQLTRLVTEPPLRARLREALAEVRPSFGWDRVVDQVEDLYEEIVARRHPVPRAHARTAAKIARRSLIDVDLHMHTDHSHDCATPVEVLLDRAREVGLGAIAVTDHNEISGALDAADKASGFGVKVIVAEEIKTASQGEVIGLFIEEKIPRGLTLEETIAEIRRQGGLVYVPHPFDRLHAVPDYEHLLDVLGDVDAIEIFNPRVAISAFNEEAARFAAKYRIVAGAGSDAHVAQGLGSVRIRMRDFDGPEEFLASLRDADIVRKPASLVYVQALKFLQTKATPPGARAAVRRRRVRRATRNS